MIVTLAMFMHAAPAIVLAYKCKLVDLGGVITFSNEYINRELSPKHIPVHPEGLPKPNQGKSSKRRKSGKISQKHGNLENLDFSTLEFDAFVSVRGVGNPFITRAHRYFTT